MATLGMIHKDGVVIGCAQNIYVTSAVDFRQGAKLTFEALETDAPMNHLLNKTEGFVLEGYAPFTAELTRFEGCDETVVPQLAILCRPIIRGELTVYGPMNLEAKN